MKDLPSGVEVTSSGELGFGGDGGGRGQTRGPVGVPGDKPVVSLLPSKFKPAVGADEGILWMVGRSAGWLDWLGARGEQLSSMDRMDV